MIEKIEKSEEKEKTIYEKLQEIQSKLKVPKNQYNSFGKYYFRSTEDISEAVKPLLAEQGLLLTISDGIEQFGNRYYFKATATVYNKQGEKIDATGYAREDEKQSGMSCGQLSGATSSYARKYALNGLFAIDDTKDLDDDTLNSQNAKQPQMQPKQKNTQAPMPAPQQAKDAKNKLRQATLQGLFKNGQLKNIDPTEIVPLVKDIFNKDSIYELSDIQFENFLKEVRQRNRDRQKVKDLKEEEEKKLILAEVERRRAERMQAEEDAQWNMSDEMPI